MQQPVGKAGFRLQRMAERVAEIEQGALAAFAFVAATMAALAPQQMAMACSRAGGCAGEHVAIGLQPVEEFGIAK